MLYEVITNPGLRPRRSVENPRGCRTVVPRLQRRRGVQGRHDPRRPQESRALRRGEEVAEGRLRTIAEEASAVGRAMGVLGF